MTTMTHADSPVTLGLHTALVKEEIERFTKHVWKAIGTHSCEDSFLFTYTFSQVFREKAVLDDVFHFIQEGVLKQGFERVVDRYRLFGKIIESFE